MSYLLTTNTLLITLLALLFMMQTINNFHDSDDELESCRQSL